MISIREIQVKCEDNETGPGAVAHRREKGRRLGVRRCARGRKTEINGGKRNGLEIFESRDITTRCNASRDLTLPRSKNAVVLHTEVGGEQ